MRLSKLSPLQDRRMFGVLMAIGSLLLLIPFIYSMASHGRAGITNFRPLFLFLTVPVVYLVCRYARTSVMVKILGVCLLVMAAFLTLLDPQIDSLKWAKVAATGLCGIGLLLEVRWASYLWYTVALALLASCLDAVHEAHRDGWQYPLMSLALLSALVFLIVGGGGTVAVAKYSAAMKAARPSTPGVRSADLVGKWFGVLCTACVLLVAWQWVVSRIPDTEGFARLHSTLKPLARGGDQLPSCHKITYCGAYVELSCRYIDGPVDYYNNTNGTLTMNCGGACMGGRGPAGTTRCSACPPEEWKSCVASSASTPR